MIIPHFTVKSWWMQINHSCPHVCPPIVCCRNTLKYGAFKQKTIQVLPVLSQSSINIMPFLTCASSLSPPSLSSPSLFLSHTPSQITTRNMMTQMKCKQRRVACLQVTEKCSRIDTSALRFYPHLSLRVCVCVGEWVFEEPP